MYIYIRNMPFLCVRSNCKPQQRLLLIPVRVKTSYVLVLLYLSTWYIYIYLYIPGIYIYVNIYIYIYIFNTHSTLTSRVSDRARVLYVDIQHTNRSN